MTRVHQRASRLLLIHMVGHEFTAQWVPPIFREGCFLLSLPIAGLRSFQYGLGQGSEARQPARLSLAARTWLSSPHISFFLIIMFVSYTGMTFLDAPHVVTMW